MPDSPFDFQDDEEADTGDYGSIGTGAYGSLSAEDAALPDYLSKQIEQGRGLVSQSMGALSGYEKSAQTALAEKKRLIQAGLDKLLAKPVDRTPLMLSMAAGLLKPTRTGSFFESLGQAGENAVPALQREQALTDERDKNALGYQMSAVGADADAAKLSAETALKRATLGRGLTGDALKLQNQIMMLKSRQAGAKDLAALRERLSKPKPTEAQKNALALYPDDPEKQRLYIERVTTQAKDKSGKDYAALSPAGKQAVDEGLEPDTAEFTKRVREISGVGTLADSVEERAKTAAALGVPLLENDPVSLLPPKKAAEVRARGITAAEKQIAEDGEKVEELKSVARQAERFSKLNENVDTGGKYAIPGVQAVMRRTDEDVGEMSKIIDRMTPAMRQGMPGAASDRDVAMFKNATVSLDSKKQVNQNITNGFVAAAQNADQRLQFKTAYLQANGSLNGSDAAWQKYLNANPIFDPKTTDKEYKLNDKRQTWQDFFGKKKDAASITPAVEMTPQEAAAAELARRAKGNK